MAKYETILFDEPADGIAKITLNRPDARNAQNYQLIRELMDAVDEAANMERRIKGSIINWN